MMVELMFMFHFKDCMHGTRTNQRQNQPLLVQQKKAAKQEVGGFLFKLMCEEETKWAQRSKVRFVREGDINTKYRQLFGCAVSSLPFRYLGIHTHHRKLINKEWKIIEYWFKKNLVAGRASYCLMVLD